MSGMGRKSRQQDVKKASIKIIRGGRVLNPKTGKQDRADILVIGDTIADIGPPDLPAPSEAELFDASEKAVVPGLVNGHIHGHGTLAKGWSRTVGRSNCFSMHFLDFLEAARWKTST